MPLSLSKTGSSLSKRKKYLQGVVSVRKQFVPLVLPHLMLLNSNRSHSSRYCTININASTVIHII